MYETYAKAFGLGIVIGMRALMGPALLSRKLARTVPVKQPTKPIHYLAPPPVAIALEVLAGTEILTDKLPGVPNRTVPFQFGGRIASGGTCGAFLSQVEGGDIPVGVVAGSLGAVVGTLAFFNLRQWLHYDLGLPDPLVALAEDALAISAGWAIVNSIQPAQQPA